MSVPHMSKYEINKVLRSAEMKGGVRLGVAFNLRRTAFLLVNEDTIVICGHEYVLDVILEKLFGQKIDKKVKKILHKTYECNIFVTFS